MPPLTAPPSDAWDRLVERTAETHADVKHILSAITTMNARHDKLAEKVSVIEQRINNPDPEHHLNHVEVVWVRERINKHREKIVLTVGVMGPSVSLAGLIASHFWR